MNPDQIKDLQARQARAKAIEGVDLFSLPKGGRFVFVAKSDGRKASTDVGVVC